jgi:hypothetical protein
MTSDQDWDPTSFDSTISDDEKWYDSVSTTESPQTNPTFDATGNYRNCTVAKHSLHDYNDHDMFYFDTETFTYDDNEENTLLCMEQSSTINLVNVEVKPDTPHVTPNATTHESKPIKITKTTPDFEALRPFFGWMPIDVIKKTCKSTTQYARTPMSAILKNHYKSPYPAFNIKRRNEPVATDTIYSDTPAIDDGSKQAQFFAGTKTMFTDVYGMKTGSQFVNTLEDCIREQGAMTQLVSDSAKVETSKRVLELIRALCISNWNSEPHQQQQNPAK